MTLLLVPAWTLPTVTMAISPGVTSRDTTVCSRTMIMAASTTGSMPFCGRAPWLPRPYTVTLMLSSADINGPEHVPTVPAMPGSRPCAEPGAADDTPVPKITEQADPGGVSWTTR